MKYQEFIDFFYPKLLLATRSFLDGKLTEPELELLINSIPEYWDRVEDSQSILSTEKEKIIFGTYWDLQGVLGDNWPAEPLNRIVQVSYDYLTGKISIDPGYSNFRT